MAEATGAPDPQPLQRLLYSARWDADAVRDELQGFIIERFGAADGIGVLDETGFLKKGTKSVGVQRQYTGTAGKIENCQVGVFLSYFNGQGCTFLDRRLYLPQSWCTDEERRQEAKVPTAVTFQTKPELAVAMLEHAWAQGVPMAWVTGDAVYGNAPYLRDAIARAGKKYVLAVAATTPVWRERPPVDEPQPRAGRGRPQEKPRLAADAPAAETVAAVVASLAPQAWRRLTVNAGEKGPRTYSWARVRVVESRDGLPGPAAWLLARRSLTAATDIAYHLSNAPQRTSLRTLATVAAARWSVETTIEEGKGAAGLDEYEVRYWHSWHRHITLSMMAHAWLAATRQVAGEKSTGPAVSRSERARGAPAAVDRVTAAGTVPATALGLVPLAPGQTPASSSQPLPPPGGALARNGHP